MSRYIGQVVYKAGNPRKIGIVSKLRALSEDPHLGKSRNGTTIKWSDGTEGTYLDWIIYDFISLIEKHEKALNSHKERLKRLRKMFPDLIKSSK